MSGGEKQRASFARAFLMDAPLLLLDEPFSSLDTARKIRLVKVFCELWQEKKPTAVFVTHDLEEAFMLAHRVVVLKGGQVVCDVLLPKCDLPRVYGATSPEKEEILKALM